jgi:hypothetical protein
LRWRGSLAHPLGRATIDENVSRTYYGGLFHEAIAIETSRMPEIVADSILPPCYHLFFGVGL